MRNLVFLLLFAILVCCSILFQVGQNRSFPLSQKIEAIKPNIVRVCYLREKQFYPLGTGFAVSRDGIIFTCAHVIDPDNKRDLKKLPDIYIIKYNYTTRRNMSEQEISRVTVKECDFKRDFAILKSQESFENPVKLGSFKNVQEGDEVYFCGYPFNILVPSTYRGMVSAKGDKVIKEFSFDLLQIDASVNHGLSGCPLIDVKTNKAVGIINAKWMASDKQLEYIRNIIEKNSTEKGEDYSKDPLKMTRDIMEYISMNANVGIGFAVSIDYSKAVLERK